MSGEDDVAFRLLHTADWHLGKRFPSFDESAEKDLRRARLDVLSEVFAAATRNVVDAVLCAGDLFDEPNPPADWWRGLLHILRRLPSGFPPVFLLPGNHDPLLSDSVWMTGHPFRAGLPGFVRVVEREDFREEIKPGLVLYAVPCFLKAGADDPVDKIPPRMPGDESVRVGLVHGTTFDLANCEIHFPIRAGGARARGLDYLAIGDTHGYRVVQDDPPVVYPGAPEPTAFDEIDAGHVVLVCFTRTRGRPHLRKVPVARWKWRYETIRDLGTLRALAADDLHATVLRIAFDLDVDLRERDEIERILDGLAGNEAQHSRVGVLDADRAGIRIRISSVAGAFPPNLPPVLQTVVDNLQAIAADRDPDAARRARIALYKLSALTQPRSPR
ncbi:MAG TPA: DNA repair exonuclease [Polyangia bacterium]|nr:DNA repair exonuclease [Polyangia bacterium]